jgi:beta-lactamase regulating signal transducer with metallopeptidase domain
MSACDSMVVGHLSLEEKRYYAHTLLSMYKKASAPQMVPGMALGGTRRNAEQRIRGIYMKRKSKFNIKMIAVLLAGVIGVCCFTTACQPTPESEIVVNKNNGKLETAIHESDNQAAEPETGQTGFTTGSARPPYGGNN